MSFKRGSTGNIEALKATDKFVTEGNLLRSLAAQQPSAIQTISRNGKSSLLSTGHGQINGSGVQWKRVDGSVRAADDGVSQLTDSILPLVSNEIRGLPAITLDVDPLNQKRVADRLLAHSERYFALHVICIVI